MTRYEKQSNFICLFFSDTKRIWGKGTLKKKENNKVFIEVIESVRSHVTVGMTYCWPEKFSTRGSYKVGDKFDKI